MSKPTAPPEIELVAQVADRLFQGHVTTFDFWCRNTSGSPLRDVEVRLAGRLLGRGVSRDLGSFKPGEQKKCFVETELAIAGDPRILVELAYRLSGNDRRATGDLPCVIVPSADREPDQIEIHAHRLIISELSSWFPDRPDHEQILKRGPAYAIPLSFEASTEPSEDRADSDEPDANVRLIVEWRQAPVHGGNREILSFRLRNDEEDSIELVQLGVRCDGLRTCSNPRLKGQLRPGVRKTTSCEIEALPVEGPATAWAVAEILLIYKDVRGNPNVLRGEMDLPVLPLTAAMNSPAAPFDRDFPWARVPLEYDPDWSDVLRGEGGTEDSPPPVGEIVPAPAARKVFELVVRESSGEERRIRLHLADRLSIGRRRTENAVAPRFLPRDHGGPNDDISANVSARHAEMVQMGECFVLEDAGSTNGTRLDERVLRTESAPLVDGSMFHLGCVIGFRYAEFRDFKYVASQPAPRRDATNRTTFAFGKELRDAIERSRQEAPLLAARIRRVDRGSDRVDHVLVVRAAMIGSERGVPIVIRDRELAERHARLRVSGGRLCVEDLNSVSGTWLDGRQLMARQPVPLPETCTLRLGTAEIRVQALPSSAVGR